ncbi:MAG: hypothetical protein IT554_02200 [Sphingomonadaceae bacterium]|nr:hypothetical protein [Sphingomonadaceae bacterium]
MEESANEASPPPLATEPVPWLVARDELVVELSELSLLSELSDMSRLSVAVLPLFAATCAPEADDVVVWVWVELSELSVSFV